MKLIKILFLMFLIFITGCSINKNQEQEVIRYPIEKPLPAWFNFELKDIITQKTFTLNDFKGKTILLESFAVWCPIGELQEREIKRVYESETQIIPISLDTDPDEPESKILEHMEKNDFIWTYAHSPAELTRDLIKEFGVGIVNAPAAPMILICPNQSYKLIEKKGIKSSLDLKEALNSCN